MNCIFLTSKINNNTNNTNDNRAYSSLSKELSAVITDMALRGRDRMDTSYVAECNSKAVANIIQRMKYLVHTLVPEMFWKEYGNNSGAPAARRAAKRSPITI